MSILIDKDTRVLVQGFTGSQGTLHSSQSIEYGTNVVGGVTPGKGGASHLDLPVFNSVKEAVEQVQPNASLIFVPAPFCKGAILEAADAGIKFIVCITEGVPTLDMLEVKRLLMAWTLLSLGLTVRVLLPLELGKWELCLVRFIFLVELELYLDQGHLPMKR